MDLNIDYSTQQVKIGKSINKHLLGKPYMDTNLVAQKTYESYNSICLALQDIFDLAKELADENLEKFKKFKSQDGYKELIERFKKESKLTGIGYMNIPYYSKDNVDEEIKDFLDKSSSVTDFGSFNNTFRQVFKNGDITTLLNHEEYINKVNKLRMDLNSRGENGENGIEGTPNLFINIDIENDFEFYHRSSEYFKKGFPFKIRPILVDFAPLDTVNNINNTLPIIRYDVKISIRDMIDWFHDYYYTYKSETNIDNYESHESKISQYVDILAREICLSVLINWKRISNTWSRFHEKLMTEHNKMMESSYLASLIGKISYLSDLKQPIIKHEQIVDLLNDISGDKGYEYHDRLDLLRDIMYAFGRTEWDNEIKDKRSYVMAQITKTVYEHMISYFYEDATEVYFRRIKNTEVPSFRRMGGFKYDLTELRMGIQILTDENIKDFFLFHYNNTVKDREVTNENFNENYTKQKMKAIRARREAWILTYTILSILFGLSKTFEAVHDRSELSGKIKRQFIDFIREHISVLRNMTSEIGFCMYNDSYATRLSRTVGEYDILNQISERLNLIVNSFNFDKTDLFSRISLKTRNDFNRFAEKYSKDMGYSEMSYSEILNTSFQLPISFNLDDIGNMIGMREHMGSTVFNRQILSRLEELEVVPRQTQYINN